MIELVAKQLGSPIQIAHQLLCVGVEHELVGIEAVTGVRLIRTVDAVAVDRSGPRRREIAVPDFIGIFGKLDPLEFGFTVSSNRQSSTFVACAENSAKLTPEPSHVAPRGNGLPSVTRERRRLAAARVNSSRDVVCSSIAAPKRTAPLGGLLVIEMSDAAGSDPTTVTITAAGGSCGGCGMMLARCAVASLPIAEIELPIRPTIALSSVSERRNRFFIRRTCARSPRSSLFRIGCGFDRSMALTVFSRNKDLRAKFLAILKSEWQEEQRLPTSVRHPGGLAGWRKEKNPGQGTRGSSKPTSPGDSVVSTTDTPHQPLGAGGGSAPYAAVEAFLLTSLRRAIVLSFVFAAFSCSIGG